jgi:hypothetical protein
VSRALISAAVTLVGAGFAVFALGAVGCADGEEDAPVTRRRDTGADVATDSLFGDADALADAVDAPDGGDGGDAGDSGDARDASDTKPIVPAECSEARSYSDPKTGVCFFRDERQGSKSVGEDTCRSKGAELARWSSAAQRDAAHGPTVAYSGSSIVWIGLTYDGSQWSWADGKLALDVPWAGGFPRAGQSCAVWRANGTVESSSCSERRDVVCVRFPP